MPLPILTVRGSETLDNNITVGTIVEHNDPPQLLVIVTEEPDATGAFSGLCLTDWTYMDHNWESTEFHVFRGSVTLTQGV